MEVKFRTYSEYGSIKVEGDNCNAGTSFFFVTHRIPLEPIVG